LLEAWEQASDRDRKIIRDIAITMFFEHATSTDLLNQLVIFERRNLLEAVLKGVVGYILGGGYPELAQILFDAFGPKYMLETMSPQFKAALSARLLPESRDSKAS
jgi:hypothetical protein